MTLLRLPGCISGAVSSQISRLRCTLSIDEFIHVLYFCPDVIVGNGFILVKCPVFCAYCLVVVEFTSVCKETSADTADRHIIITLCVSVFVLMLV